MLLRHFGAQGLLAAEEIEIRYVVNAAYRTVRGTGLLGQVLAADIFDRVLIEGLGRVASLLGAIMDQAVLADIHVAGAGAAAPFVGLSLRDGILKEIQAREVTVLQRLHLVIHLALALP